LATPVGSGATGSDFSAARTDVATWAGLPPPPSAGSSPGVGWQTESSASPRRATTILSIVVVVALLGAGALWFVAGRGGGLPGSIQSLERLDTAPAKAFESYVDSIQIAGADYRGAMYGSGGQPALIVVQIQGLPAYVRDAPIDTFFDQAASGFTAGASVSIDTAARVIENRSDVQYMCAPTQGSMGLGLPSGGSVCLWNGTDVGLVFTFRTSEPTAAIDDAEFAYQAFH
jgi:hypothetical protein